MLSPSGLAGSSSNGRYPASIAYWRQKVSQTRKRLRVSEGSYQDDTTAPHIDLCATIQAVAHHKLGSCVAGASARSGHEIAPSQVVPTDLIKPMVFNEFAIVQIVFGAFWKLVAGIKGIGEAKVSDYDVLRVVKKEILEFQVSMDDPIPVKVADARDKLCEKPTSLVVVEVSVLQDMIKELAARCVFENKTKRRLGIDHFVEVDNVGVVKGLEDGDLSIDLRHPSLGIEFAATDDFDSHGLFFGAETLFESRVFWCFPTDADLAKLALSERVAKCVSAQLIMRCFVVGTLGATLLLVGLRVLWCLGILQGLDSADMLEVPNSVPTLRFEILGFRLEAGPGFILNQLPCLRRHCRKPLSSSRISLGPKNKILPKRKDTVVDCRSLKVRRRGRQASFEKREGVLEEGAPNGNLQGEVSMSSTERKREREYVCKKLRPRCRSEGVRVGSALGRRARGSRSRLIAPWQARGLNAPLQQASTYGILQRTVLHDVSHVCRVKKQRSSEQSVDRCGDAQRQNAEQGRSSTGNLLGYCVVDDSTRVFNETARQDRAFDESAKCWWCRERKGKEGRGGDGKTYTGESDVS